MENNNELWKGYSFWNKEIEQAGIKDGLRFYNDIITEKRPPHPDAGYGDPVVTDAILDGKKVDIYHTDHDDGDSWHRLFLHIKE